MTAPRYRLVPCPREGVPAGVMIEQWAPDPDAAAKAGKYFTPREEWPYGWIPFTWHASAADAKEAAARRMNFEKAQATRHISEAAAWAEMEVV